MKRLSPQRLGFARHLRKESTDVEKILWLHLRARRLAGVKFRRQQIIRNYIVDFVSQEKKLIIELDGGQHNNDENKYRDVLRTQVLQRDGYRVLRFWNNEVTDNLEDVLDVIYRTLFPSP
jgi:very-short-patch-repair endonuclease